jgi:release factor glutamine methyltransferase
VYVPRLQSEELARRAVALLPDRGRAVDLCTGCGAIAVTMRAARPAATVVGVDLDPRAVVNARGNGVEVARADLGEALRPHAVDVVTCVAPYVPTGELRLLPSDVLRYEPSLALDGGGDGLVVLRRVIASAARLLRPGGWLLVELGGSQDEALDPALEDSAFEYTETWSDEAGDLRGLAARIAV